MDEKIFTWFFIIGLIVGGLLLILNIVNTVVDDTVEIILGFLLILSSTVLYSEALQN